MNEQNSVTLSVPNTEIIFEQPRLQNLLNLSQRVIGSWRAEAETKNAENLEFQSLSLSEQIKRACVSEWWNGTIWNTFGMHLALLCVLFVIAVVISFFCSLPEWISFLELLTWIFPILYLVFILGAPIYFIYEGRSKAKNTRSFLEKDLADKTSRFMSDPLFMIDSIKECVDKNIEQYQARLIEVEADLKKAVIIPRGELVSRLAQLEVDQLRFEKSLKNEEDKKRGQDLLSSRHSQLKSMIDELTPKEVSLCEQLESIKQSLKAAENRSSSLITFRADFEDESHYQARIQEYLRNDPKWNQVLEAKRNSLLASVENTMNELATEIEWTNRGLTELSSQIPKIGTYELKLLS